MHDFGGPPPGVGMAGLGNPMKLIQKAIMSQGIQSPEELEKFLNERVVGRPLEALAAEFASAEPTSDLERAEYLMEEVSEGASPSAVRRTAKKALGISRSCLSAWLALGVHQDDPAKALGYFDQGIEQGRIRFASLIESIEDGQGLWGWIEARDFMRLLHNRARVLEAMAEFDKAVETYQEMIALNPGDNQGVRGDLLHLLITKRKNHEARELLKRFPNDADISMAYGSALLEFMHVMDQASPDFFLFEGLGRRNLPKAAMNKLGPEYNKAKKLLKYAVKLNPFVPWMMTHPQIMGVMTDGMHSFGGPYEAVEYVQARAVLWYVRGLPFIAMTASMVADPLRHAKLKQMKEELIDILRQLDSLDGTPWWESFESGDES